MFEIFVRTHFSAAHHLANYAGNCAKWHGHNWEVEATVELASEAGEAAFAAALDTWVGGLDYRLLNDLPGLAGRNPTAELLAEHAFLHLQASALQPCWVKVREKNNYWAMCRAGEGR